MTDPSPLPEDFLTESKPRVSSFEQKPDLSSFEQKPVVSPFEQKPNISSFEQKPNFSSFEQKPDVPNVDVKPEVPQGTFIFFSEDPDFAERMEKYNKYQHDYVRRLKAKYFSKKAWNGDYDFLGEVLIHSDPGASIFDEETQIENEIIRSSRWPCTKSFIDPQLYFEDQNRLAGSTTSGPSSTTPEKKPQINKNS